MINRYLFLYVIHKKDMSTLKIANILGISRMALNNRLSGKIHFHTDEVATLRRILELTNDEVCDIFIN